MKDEINLNNSAMRFCKFIDNNLIEDKKYVFKCFF